MNFQGLEGNISHVFLWFCLVLLSVFSYFSLFVDHSTLCLIFLGGFWVLHCFFGSSVLVYSINQTLHFHPSLSIVENGKFPFLTTEKQSIILTVQICTAYHRQACKNRLHAVALHLWNVFLVEHECDLNWFWGWGYIKLAKYNKALIWFSFIS